MAPDSMSNQVQRIQLPPVTAPVKRQTPLTGPNFADVLQQQIGLKVSAHAQTRFSSRNIALDADQWQRVASGVEKAASKGSKESLVLMDDVALVVSVRNRTVITAVDKENLKDNVFTNIDSAVIV